MLSFKSLGLDLRITPSLSLPRAPHIPPGRPKMTTLVSLLAIFSDFFAFQHVVRILLRKNIEKKCENQGFGPPKTLPKSTPKRIPPNMQCFVDFDPKNLLLRKCQRRFRIGFYSTKWLSDVFLHVAFCMDLGSKKPSKNLLKTMPGRPKNRSRKHVVF